VQDATLEPHASLERVHDDPVRLEVGPRDAGFETRLARRSIESSREDERPCRLPVSREPSGKGRGLLEPTIHSEIERAPTERRSAVHIDAVAGSLRGHPGDLDRSAIDADLRLGADRL
jgi:hypothetical protein